MVDDRNQPFPAGPGQPPDRVFLSNYVRAFEIGAYAEERGQTQRLRFDVVIEVVPPGAEVDDRSARVVNYDEIVEAIEALIAGPRINLLETFAERLAEDCLADPRARRVHVRIQKLDRLDGEARLGIEICRVRTPEMNERVWAARQE